MAWEQAEHVGVTRAGRAVAPRARGGGFGGDGGAPWPRSSEDEDALATPPPTDASAAAASSSAAASPLTAAPAAFAEDVARSRFPFCVVWTPLPLITWILPFIGHMGIADSRGVIYDFAGPFTIGVDSFAFGEPVRVLRLRPERAAATAAAGAGETAAQAWDRCVDRGCDAYVARMHVMLYDDCHDHVARCLNEMRYGGSARWNKVSLAALLFFSGSFVTPRRTLAAYLPAVVIWTAIALLLWRR